MTANTKAKNKQMVANILKRGMTQQEAYAHSRGRDMVLPSDNVNASITMAKPETQAMMQQMRQKFLLDADRAYQRGWQTAEDEATPPHVALKWYADVLDRAGLGNVDLAVHKHEHTVKFPDLLMSKEEIIEILNEPESASVITKRNE